MAVWIKINKDEVSLEEIQFLFENPKDNFDIRFKKYKEKIFIS